MKALFSNFKMVSLALFMAMTIVTTFLLSSFDAKAINCFIICENCKKYDVTHTHNSETGVIYVVCRNCGHDFYL